MFPTEVFWTKLKLVGHDEPIWISHETPRELVRRLRSIAKSKGKRHPAKIERILVLSVSVEYRLR